MGRLEALELIGGPSSGYTFSFTTPNLFPLNLMRPT
jgi:hypothetical protein